MAKSGDTVELPDPLGDGFDQPQEISDLLFAFPAQVGHLMPSMEDIPEEFQRPTGNEWSRFVSEWFFLGWPKRGLFPRPDVDPEKAYRHLAAIMKSFEPKHEHKEAAVAWLASRWYAAVGEDTPNTEEENSNDNP